MSNTSYALPVLRGRGTSWNPPNRFEKLSLDREGWTDPDDPPPQTQLLNDTTRSILAYNDAPDVGFNVGINDGQAAGQTVSHAHVHIIPRYQGDVPDPRGGVRWIIPEKAVYWEDPS